MAHRIDNKFNFLLQVLLVIAIASVVYVKYNEVLHKNNDVVLVDEVMKLNIDNIKRYVKDVTSWGARGFGSKNLNKTLYYTLEEVMKIGESINGGDSSIHNYNAKVFYENGNFTVEILKNSVNTLYTSLPNLIFVLEPKKIIWSSKKKAAYLFNCHLDTVLNSPGAGDNLKNCAIMLEIIRELSKLKRSNFEKNYDIPVMLFLFNGAEERGLTGAKAFLSSPYFSKYTIEAVVNLDSAGTGGREYLFRTTGQEWLLRLYMRVAPYPSGNIISEDVYNTGVIPSATDFLIFQKFSDMAGYDIAFSGNGFYYHTTRDSYEAIQHYSFEMATANLANLAYTLYTGKNMRNLNATRFNLQSDKLVFFDFLGLKMFIMPFKSLVGMTIAICFVVAVDTLLRDATSNRRSDDGIEAKLKLLIRYLLIVTFSAVSAFIFTFLFAKILLYVQLNMIWFSHQPLVFMMYGFPFFVIFWKTFMFMENCFVVSSKLYLKYFTISSTTNLILLIALIELINLEIRSAYIFLILLIPSLASELAQFIIKVTSRYFRIDKDIYAKLIYNTIYIVCSILVLSHFYHMMYILLSTIVPISGRIPSSISSEYMIVLIINLSTFLFTITTLPFFYRTKSGLNLFLKVLTVASIVTYTLIFCGFITSFSSELSPKRFVLTHANVVNVTKNGRLINKSYICALSNDNRYMIDLPKFFNEEFTLKKNVEHQDLFPAILHLLSRFSKFDTDIRLKSAKSKHAFNKAFGVLVKSKVCNHSCLYSFELSGKGIILFYLRSANQLGIMNSSLFTLQSVKTIKLQNGETVFSAVLYKNDETFFAFNFEVPNSQKKSVRLQVSTDDPDFTKTPEIDSLIQKYLNTKTINTFTLATTLYNFEL